MRLIRGMFFAQILRVVMRIVHVSHESCRVRSAPAINQVALKEKGLGDLLGIPEILTSV